MSAKTPRGQQHSRVNSDQTRHLGGLLVGGLGSILLAGRAAGAVGGATTT